MKTSKPFLELAYLHVEANNIILSTLPLQIQILNCNTELATLIASENSAIHKDRIRDLKDEIFGCEIEIQSLRYRARKLIKQAKNLRCKQNA